MYQSSYLVADSHLVLLLLDVVQTLTLEDPHLLASEAHHLHDEDPPLDITGLRGLIHIDQEQFRVLDLDLLDAIELVLSPGLPHDDAEAEETVLVEMVVGEEEAQAIAATAAMSAVEAEAETGATKDDVDLSNGLSWNCVQI